MNDDEIARRVAEVRQSMRGRSAGWDNVNSCRSWADVRALVAALDRAEAERDALRAELAAVRSATLDEAIARVAAWGETEHDYADPYWRGYRSGNDDAVVELRLMRDGEPSVSPPRSPTSEEP